MSHDSRHQLGCEIIRRFDKDVGCTCGEATDPTDWQTKSQLRSDLVDQKARYEERIAIIVRERDKERELAADIATEQTIEIDRLRARLAGAEVERDDLRRALVEFVEAYPASDQDEMGNVIDNPRSLATAHSKAKELLASFKAESQ